MSFDQFKSFIIANNQGIPKSEATPSESILRELFNAALFDKDTNLLNLLEF
jgi:hypothetical protein